MRERRRYRQADSHLAQALWRRVLGNAGARVDVRVPGRRPPKGTPEPGPDISTDRLAGETAGH